MANKMLIDAAHPEETRVVVVRGNRVEEFDFEARAKRPLRGNIYLARVTRVEPSLQAAFVEYGGNRHGFLAFSEIHPDYYQIPHSDRQALLAEEEDEELEDARDEEAVSDSGDTPDASASEEADEDDASESDADNDTDEPSLDAEPADDTDEKTVELSAGDDPAISEDVVFDDDETSEILEAEAVSDDESHDDASDDDEETDDDENVDSVGSEDALEEVPSRPRKRRRQYKIQEVIKRKQVLLIQVVKEERGNKGAALTTYLSLAGRYCVLMPNTARGGGISRKITATNDRKRLKEVARELDVPQGMGVILRTAGASRTKPEIRRDFEYLLRLWENVRTLTLDSTAPSLVYEEGNLVKRAIRDLYSKEIDEVLVAGDESYREAKDFMRMLMPSHAKNIQPYKEHDPLFAHFGIEPQLDALFSPQVTLKSGGYIVINQTEALVAIDVNSGRATKEHSIEDTALKTNLEAAAEISRQLRLRDLAGLIVIDFIDMDENRNNRAVERKLKECLKSDRARIQVGRISHFGLMEMSRQRIRAGIMEGSFQTCPSCSGVGVIRSTESIALHILRAIEDEMLRKPCNLKVKTRANAALYCLNQKRQHLAELETRFGVEIAVEAVEGHIDEPFLLERGAPARHVPEPARETRVIVAEDGAEAEETSTESEDEGSNGTKRRRRRRRRGGEGRSETANSEVAVEASDEDDENASEAVSDDDSESDDAPRRRRKRGRRGGRRRRGRNGAEGAEASADDENASASDEDGQDAGDDSEGDADPTGEQPAVVTAEAGEETVSTDVSAEGESAEAEAEAKPKRRRRRSTKKTVEAEAEAETKTDDSEPVASEAAAIDEPEQPVAEPESVPEPEPTPQPEPEIVAEPEAVEEVAEVAVDEAPAADEPRRRGWWQRALSRDA